MSFSSLTNDEEEKGELVGEVVNIQRFGSHVLGEEKWDAEVWQLM